MSKSTQCICACGGHGGCSPDFSDDDAVRGLNFSISFALSVLKPLNEEEQFFYKCMLKAADLLKRHQLHHPLNDSLLTVD